MLRLVFWGAGNSRVAWRHRNDPLASLVLVCRDASAVRIRIRSRFKLPSKGSQRLKLHSLKASIFTLAESRKRGQLSAHRCPPRKELPGNQRSRRWARRAGERQRERATTRCRALEASKISTLLGCRGQWASQQARAGWPHFNPLLAAMGTSGRRNEFDHLPNTAPLADGEV